MPYIKNENGRREALQKGDTALNAGELNYQIFYYVKHSKDVLCGDIIGFVYNFLSIYPNYQKYNDMVGCLVLCAKEIKRRLKLDLEKDFMDIINSYDKKIANYEDDKIKENSDVE